MYFENTNQCVDFSNSVSVIRFENGVVVEALIDGVANLNSVSVAVFGDSDLPLTMSNGRLFDSRTPAITRSDWSLLTRKIGDTFVTRGVFFPRGRLATETANVFATPCRFVVE